MLELHARQVDTVDATAIKRARKNEKSNLVETKQKCRLGTASNEITGGGGGAGASTSLRSTNPRP